MLVIVVALLAMIIACIVYRYGPKFIILLPNLIVIEKIAFLIEQGKLEELKQIAATMPPNLFVNLIYELESK